MKKEAFTIVEVMIVIALTAILTAFFFPAFVNAKKEAKKTDCLSNLRQIGQASLMYAEGYEDFLPPYSTTESGVRGLGNWIACEPKKWRDSFLPYASKSTDIFRCDLDPNWGNDGFLSYLETRPADATEDQIRTSFTSYPINSQLQADNFGSPEGAFRLCLSSLPSKWPFEPSMTVYISDAIWEVPYDKGVVFVSGHGYKEGRLYLDGHVANKFVVEE